jgi:hypothetical protein
MVCGIFDIPYTVVDPFKAEDHYRRLLMEAILEGSLDRLISELRGAALKRTREA